MPSAAMSRACRWYSLRHAGQPVVLRRVALLSDAVSHAVLPGIVAVWLVAHTRAPLPVIVGAAVFAVQVEFLVPELGHELGDVVGARVLRQLDPDRVLDPGDEVDVGVGEPAGSLPDPDEVARSVVEVTRA